ncbi:MAG: hypothetical protein Kow0076_3660 [Francisella sp.]
MIKKIITICCVTVLLSSHAFSRNFTIEFIDETPNEENPLVDHIDPVFFDTYASEVIDNIKFDVNKQSDALTIASTNLPDDFSNMNKVVLTLLDHGTMDQWEPLAISIFKKGKLSFIDGHREEITISLASLYKDTFNVHAHEIFYTEEGDIIGEFTIHTYKDGDYVKAKVTAPETINYKGQKIRNSCTLLHDYDLDADFPECEFPSVSDEDDSKLVTKVSIIVGKDNI